MEIMAFLKINFFFLIINLFSACNLPTLSERSEVEPEIYSCFMDPEVNELMQHAVQLKNYSEANEILLNLLSIRPNCIDLHQALAMNYALLNDMKNFQKYNNKVKFLQTEYDLKSGKYYNRIEKKISDASKPKIIYSEPPRYNRLDYWRWKYIYNQRRY
jgi:hypothetical protein